MTLAIQGSATTNASNSISLPAHAIGDDIYIWAFNLTNTNGIAKPGAGGTVPDWLDIDNNAGANNCQSRDAHVVATATNHTSGTWTWATHMIAVVLRGQNDTPVGGHDESGGSSNSDLIAPSVTMGDTSGNSLLFHAFGCTIITAWQTISGYTRQVYSGTSGNPGVCLYTKNSTTSDGSLTSSSGSFGCGYRGATVEVRAPSILSPKSMIVTAAANIRAAFY